MRIYGKSWGARTLAERGKFVGVFKQARDNLKEAAGRI